MAQLLGILQLIGMIVPLVEQMFAGRQGAGTQKLDAALTLVKSAVTVAPAMIGAVQGAQAAIHAGNVDQLTPHLGALISQVVSVANASGVFQKSALVQNAAPIPADFPRDLPAGG